MEPTDEKAQELVVLLQRYDRDRDLPRMIEEAAAAEARPDPIAARMLPPQ